LRFATLYIASFKGFLMSFSFSRFSSLIIAALLLLLTGCGTHGPETLSLHSLAFSDLSQWDNGNHLDALSAYQGTCRYWQKRPHKMPKTIAGLTQSHVAWQRSCDAALAVDVNDNTLARNFFVQQFQPYRGRSSYGKSDGLLTGYYEPLLKGSLTKTEQYSVPVYAVPRDLQKGVGYFTREEIERNGLDGRADILLYVDSVVDLFFLHIQGSGRVLLDTGETVGLGFANKNNRDYVSIGKLLIEAEEIPREEMSMQRLKAWLHANPIKGQQIMWQNPSYVFFQRNDATGPVGAHNVPLTAEASLAIDPAFVPYGMPIWLQTTLPARAEGDNETIYNRLVITQDTGGAIKGALRGDVFFGGGERAEWLAGHMQQRGDFIFLLPRPASL